MSLKELKMSKKWVDSTYQKLTMDQKLGQLFILALYNNRGEAEIEKVRKLVSDEQPGGLILMQNNAKKHIELLNEFNSKSKIPLLVGMDAEWGLYQRIDTAYKFPWAIVLGAIQDKSLIKNMAAQIAKDAQKMGVNWDFAPVVDVNTNPNNPIIGNRSFGSEVANVKASALAYAEGLQENNVLAAIKHFPGHGDTDTDSHLDLPKLSHSLSRLEQVELAPFKELMDKGIGGVMVAHLYVPAMEKKVGIPASVSFDIITKWLKDHLKYKGLIITDALNMGAVTKRFPAGKLDAMAFAAGNDIMLFSEDIKRAKKIILEQITSGVLPESRLEESVKKILLAKYNLGLKKYVLINSQNIDEQLNNQEHIALGETLFANAVTLLKDEKKQIPLRQSTTYFYLPLEEASNDNFYNTLKQSIDLKKIGINELTKLPKNSKIIVGLHKDNSTAYKSYKISLETRKVLAQLNNQQVIICLFGSPYALKDLELPKMASLLIAYENHPEAGTATAKALLGQTKINGKLPVAVSASIDAGMGISK